MKLEAIDKINTITSTKILSVYPDWKQRNMTARFVELITLNETTSEEAVAIQSAWSWIKSVRDASNVATNGINNATNYPDIRTIVENYNT